MAVDFPDSHAPANAAVEASGSAAVPPAFMEAPVIGSPVPPPPVAPHSGLIQGWPASYGGAYQSLNENGVPAPCEEDSGLKVSQSMFDTWRVPLIPEVKDIKNVIKASLCLPCVAAGQQDDIARTQAGIRVLPFSGVAPLIVMDVLPCLCCGIPLPFGSCTATIDNRRALRNRYRIHGSVMQDALSSVCLPCTMVQMAKEMQTRGDQPCTFSME